VRVEPCPVEFFESVDTSGGPTSCWPGGTSVNGRGYGQFYVGGRMWLAHRLAFCLVHGFESLAPGQVVMHACDNPPCCNPAHLRRGTLSDNTRDAVTKGRWSQAGGLQPPGSARPTAKLTESDVAEARRLRSSTEESYVSLGRRFGVSHTTMRRAISGTTWSHVTKKESQTHA